jgi:hypothetical protein
MAKLCNFQKWSKKIAQSGHPDGNCPFDLFRHLYWLTFLSRWENIWIKKKSNFTASFTYLGDLKITRNHRPVLKFISNYLLAV